MHTNKTKLEKGKLLIAEPFLNDPYFKRTVILLIEHNEKGSMGIILNKMVENRLHEVIDNFPESDFMVNIGGPVSEDSLFYLHNNSKIPTSLQIYNNLYFGGDYELIKKMVQNKSIDKNTIRFFIGYAGWTKNQLEQEIKENSWIITDYNSKLIFDLNTKLIWKKAIESLGNAYKLMINFPENPILN